MFDSINMIRVPQGDSFMELAKFYHLNVVISYIIIPWQLHSWHFLIIRLSLTSKTFQWIAIFWRNILKFSKVRLDLHQFLGRREPASEYSRYLSNFLLLFTMFSLLPLRKQPIKTKDCKFPLNPSIEQCEWGPRKC